METPRTNAEVNQIQIDLSSMKLDDWNAAFHRMREHAEKLEIELQEAKEDAEYAWSRVSC